MNSKTKRLTTGAALVALSAILSIITFYRLPYGGSITAVSMLPVCVYAHKHGLKWGLLGGLAFGITQLLFGASSAAFAGMTAGAFILMAFLDYILAYACMGLTALGKGRFGLGLGILIAAGARLLAHALSGYILFRQYAEWFFSQDGFAFGEWVLSNMGGQTLAVFYSFFYNASFLVPETILTVIAAAAVTPALKKIGNRF